ncbi:MAG: DUF1080 domain-containing protein [Kiritimatiellae bacterium]|nr:DUF1080 domain-containing protein [Kiritimatiellia bacterium]MDD5519889.1 DUF1080 domain-containing protein [Kiritimatiellia bacterium]
MKNDSICKYLGTILALICLGNCVQAAVGYDNTPLIPGQKWRVHDSTRPQPVVVQPGTFSSQEQAGKPPSDAIILFDGKDLSKWYGNETITNDGKKVIRQCEAKWKIEKDYMEVVPKTGAIFTKDGFGSCQLHVEWAAPTEIKTNSQGRGNSGIFLMNKYEVQILDSYDNETYADGHAASIYGSYPPQVNAVRKPGEWQVYDIVFDAPVFKDGKIEKPAYVTVFVNGVLAQNHVEILGTTFHKKAPAYQPHGDKEPIQLQDHNNTMRFRNIWIRPLKEPDLK